MLDVVIRREMCYLEGDRIITETGVAYGTAVSNGTVEPGGTIVAKEVSIRGVDTPPTAV